MIVETQNTKSEILDKFKEQNFKALRIFGFEKFDIV